MKVGTSTVANAGKRLAEQGAWLARFVAETADGRIVRTLEDEVTEYTGLPQSVSARRKLRGLLSPVADVELEEHLAAEAQRALDDVVLPNAGDRVTPLDPRLRRVAWRHPVAGHQALGTLIDYPLSVGRGRHDLVLQTAVGRHLIAGRPGGDDHFVFDPAPLYGLWREVGDFGSDEIAIQDSLF